MSASGRTARGQATVDPVERLLARHGVRAAVAVMVVASATLGVVQGPAMAVLVLAAGAFVAAVALFWSSLRSLFRDRTMTPEEAYELVTPIGEDEHKQAVLRALRDLDTERLLGKISEQDFDTLRKRHRDEAKLLLDLQQTSDERLRKRVEELIEDHLAVEEEASDEDDLDDEDEQDDLDDLDDDLDDEDEQDDLDHDDLDEDEDEDDHRQDGDQTTRCPCCQARNDDDARFCKKCGERLHEADAEEDER